MTHSSTGEATTMHKEPVEPSELSEAGGVDADPLIGFVVSGRYRIVERLGRGGMGTVYKVEHVKLGKLLALKLLSGELAREPGVVRRFEREAFLASRLSHPSTVQVFDYGVSDGLTWLVMELVKGRDLSIVLRAEGPLGAERAVRFVGQVCGSLAEAHRHGIVHRDIKPGNIMVTRSAEGEEVAKVLDFGLAKLRESPEMNEVTGRGMMLGTPAYMAPEQIEGKPVDGRTDVYAIGALLFRLLTGEAVFGNNRGGIREMLSRHLVEPPQRPQDRAPHLNIPEELGSVVVKALSKKPADRYQTVEELRAAMFSAVIRGSLPDRMIGDNEPSLPLPLVHPENATRDEVAAYERKLVRQRWVARGVVAASLLGAVYGGFGAYRLASTPPAFEGVEAEPNNTEAQASALPFGRTISGHVGKRIDPERPDVDFYRVVVPSDAGPVSLRLTGLPNMALCALIYPSHESNPLARLCPGRPWLDLTVPSYRLDPGTYFIAVTQDRSPYRAAASPAVVENVSDAYHLTIETSAGPALTEQEPNDAPSTASPLLPGEELRGRLAWVLDQDTVCAASASARPLRWTVEHSPSLGASPSAIEATLLADDQVGVSARIHPQGTPGPLARGEHAGSWSSPLFLSSGPRTHCVRLRRVGDPADTTSEPSAGPEAWSVRLELAPEG